MIRRIVWEGEYKFKYYRLYSTGKEIEIYIRYEDEFGNQYFDKMVATSFKIEIAAAYLFYIAGGDNREYKLPTNLFEIIDVCPKGNKNE